MDPLLTGGEAYEHDARFFLLGSVVSNVRYTIERGGEERLLFVCFSQEGALKGAFCVESRLDGTGHLHHTWIAPSELQEMDPSLVVKPPIFGRSAGRRSGRSVWARIRGRS